MSNTNAPRLINDWQFKPVKDDGICLAGTLVNGQEWVTTPIRKFHKDGSRRFVATESGTVYELGEMRASLWMIGLQSRRPEIFAKLQVAGIL